MNLTESQHTGCGVNAMAAKTIALPASCCISVPLPLYIHSMSCQITIPWYVGPAMSNQKLCALQSYVRCL